MQDREQQVLDVEPPLAAGDGLAHRVLERLAQLGRDLGPPAGGAGAGRLRAGAHGLAGDPAGVERLLDRAVAGVEQEPEQQVVGLERLGAHARGLLAGAADDAAGAAGDHEPALGLLAALGVAGVGGLTGDAERVGDPLPGPAVVDRLVDVRGLPHVEPPPQLGDRREPRVRIALAGRDAEQLRFAESPPPHPARQSMRRVGGRQCALTKS